MTEAIAEAVGLIPPASKTKRRQGDRDAAPLALGSGAPAVQLIPLELLDDNPANPRDEIGDVGELAESIRSVGLLSPLVVAPGYLHRRAAGEPEAEDDGRYIVLAGHRRKKACATAPVDPVPCIVRGDLVGGRDEEAMLIENLQREDLTPLEEARGYQKLLDVGGRSQRDLADRVGRNQSHISKRLALLKLPEVAQLAVLAGEVALADAAAVASITDQPEAFADAWTRLAVNHIPAQQAVAGALQAAKDKAAKDKAIAELEAQGARVIADRLVSYDYAGYPVLLSVLPAAVRRKHDTLPCHVASVGRDGTVEWGCDKPKSHKAKPPSESAKVKAEREAAAAAAAQAQQDRVETAKRLLARKPSKDLERYALGWVVKDLIGNFGDAREIADLLGLKVATSASNGRDYLHSDAVEAYAAKGTSEAVKVLLAIVLFDAESNYSWSPDEAYEQLLEANGWTRPEGQK